MEESSSRIAFSVGGKRRHRPKSLFESQQRRHKPQFHRARAKTKTGKKQANNNLSPTVKVRFSTKVSTDVARSSDQPLSEETGCKFPKVPQELEQDRLHHAKQAIIEKALEDMELDQVRKERKHEERLDKWRKECRNPDTTVKSARAWMEAERAFDTSRRKTAEAAMREALELRQREWDAEDAWELHKQERAISAAPGRGGRGRRAEEFLASLGDESFSRDFLRDNFNGSLELLQKWLDRAHVRMQQTEQMLIAKHIEHDRDLAFRQDRTKSDIRRKFRAKDQARIDRVDKIMETTYKRSKYLLNEVNLRRVCMGLRETRGVALENDSSLWDEHRRLFAEKQHRRRSRGKLGPREVLKWKDVYEEHRVAINKQRAKICALCEKTGFSWRSNKLVMKWKIRINEPIPAPLGPDAMGDDGGFLFNQHNVVRLELRHWLVEHGKLDEASDFDWGDVETMLASTEEPQGKRRRT